jgi:hypothetical protein
MPDDQDPLRKFVKDVALAVAKLIAIIILMYFHHLIDLACKSWLAPSAPRLNQIVETGTSAAIYCVIAYLAIEIVFLFIPIGTFARRTISLIGRIIVLLGKIITFFTGPGDSGPAAQ